MHQHLTWLLVSGFCSNPSNEPRPPAVPWAAASRAKRRLRSNQAARQRRRQPGSAESEEGPGEPGLHKKSKGLEGKANLAELAQEFRTAKEQKSPEYLERLQLGASATERAKETGLPGFGPRARTLRRQLITHKAIASSSTHSLLPILGRARCSAHRGSFSAHLGTRL